MHHLQRGRITLGVLLGLALFASAAASAQTSRFEQSYDKTYFASDSELGYGVMKDARAVRSIKRLRGGSQLYDVVYTIDRGIRVTPGEAPGSPVFFFGCSFTYGEGIGDAETLPAHFARLATRKAYNFGLHGYGTHQFLRMLETKRPESIGITERPDLVVYVLLPFHVDRAAGRSPWDKKGPFYEVGDGTVKYRGPFDASDKTSAEPGAGKTISTAWRSLLGTAEEKDRMRIVQMVSRARQLIQDHYGARLVVVLWDWFPEISRIDRARAAWFRVKLAEFPLVVVSDLRPAPVDAGWYTPHDNHPTGRAHALVAKAIIDKALKD
jgi:hypothetical protein